MRPEAPEQLEEALLFTWSTRASCTERPCLNFGPGVSGPHCSPRLVSAVLFSLRVGMTLTVVWGWEKSQRPGDWRSPRPGPSHVACVRRHQWSEGHSRGWSLVGESGGEQSLQLGHQLPMRPLHELACSHLGTRLAVDCFQSSRGR